MYSPSSSLAARAGPEPQRETAGESTEKSNSVGERWHMITWIAVLALPLVASNWPQFTLDGVASMHVAGLRARVRQAQPPARAHIQPHWGGVQLCGPCGCGVADQLAQRPFVCAVPGCGKAFTRKAHLHVHETSHTGVKEFVYAPSVFACSVIFGASHPMRSCQEEGCGKAFTNNSHLRRHMKLHDESLPFQARWALASRCAWR